MSELVMKMSRIRYIKPEFFLHEGLYDAEASSGLPIRVAFAGLWTVCDKNGRFEWKPRQLKIKILPYDNVDFAKILDVLTEIGSIVKYSVDGRDYGYIPSWRKHQAIGQSEAATKFSYPAPNGSETVSEPLDGGKQENSRLNVNGNGNGKNEKEVAKGMGMENGSGSGKSIGIRNPILVAHSSFPAEQSNAVQGHSHSKPESEPKIGSPAHTSIGAAIAAVKDPPALKCEPYIRPGCMFPDDDLDLRPSDTSGQRPPYRDDVDPELGVITPAKPKPTATALRLAKAFYDGLPQAIKAEAPKTWQMLWAEDFAGLLKIADEAEIADIIRDYRRTNKAKYIVRARTFVEMFEDLAKAVSKYRKAKAAGRIKKEAEDEEIVVRQIEVEEL